MPLVRGAGSRYRRGARARGGAEIPDPMRSADADGVSRRRAAAQVKCNIMEPPRNFSCIRDEAYAAELAAARDAIFNTSNPKALHKSLDKKWVFESHYTRYKYAPAPKSPVSEKSCFERRCLRGISTSWPRRRRDPPPPPSDGISASPAAASRRRRDPPPNEGTS